MTIIKSLAKAFRPAGPYEQYGGTPKFILEMKEANVKGFKNQLAFIQKNQDEKK